MVRTAKHAKSRLRRTALVLIVVVGVLGVAVGGTAFAAYRYEQSNADRIMPGIRIDGIDVGGMTRQEAVRAVTPAVQRTLQQDLTVAAAGITWHRTLGQLGLTADVEATVDKALAVSDSLSWMSRAYRRFRHRATNASFTVPFEAKLDPAEALVTQVAKRVIVSPVNASYTLAGGEMTKVHSKPGLGLAIKKSVAALTSAVTAHQASVQLPTRSVKPKVTDRTVGMAIVVDRTTNHLYLYDNFKLIRTYGVATARQGFETPPGQWKVVSKVENPTWHNPDPTGWGAGEPLVIPPGPDNPLGTRALYLDAPGIRIHGTPDDSSVGTYASHGCIRMHIPDSEAMYPLVPVGTPVFIVGAPPWGDTTTPGPAG